MAPCVQGNSPIDQFMDGVFGRLANQFMPEGPVFVVATNSRPDVQADNDMVIGFFNAGLPPNDLGYFGV